MIDIFAPGYKPAIAKKDLIHGQYYNGHCRNATLARWNEHSQRFVYLRRKFGMLYLEEICHPIDDFVYDVFVVESVCNNPPHEIKLDK